MGIAVWRATRTSHAFVIPPEAVVHLLRTAPRDAAVLFALVGSLHAASPAYAQTLPSARELAARHDSLVGGRALLETRQSVRMLGSFTLAAAGIEAPLEILKVRPNKYLFRTSLGMMGDILSGFDGTTGRVHRLR